MPRNNVRAGLAIIELNGLKPMQRQPLFLLNTLASPFSFLFFEFIVSQGRLVMYGVAGGMVLTILSIGTSLQTDLTHYRQDLKMQEMMVASPVGAFTWVLGFALSEFVFAIPGMSIFIVLSVLLGSYVFGWVSAVAIFATLVLIWIFATSLGFTLSTYLKDVRETFAIAPILSIFLTVVPPVYYPISYIPLWLRPLAYISPTTWAANLVQGALGLTPLSLTQGLLDGAVLLACAIALFFISWAKAKWRET